MRIARLSLSFLVLSVSCSFVAAQTAPAAAGTPAFGTYTSGPDVINVGNLNVHLTIPILNKPGRAGMNFVYNLTYDNSIWQQVGFSGSLSWQPVGNWGWGGLYQSSYVTYTMTTSSGSCGQYGQYSWQSWTYTNLIYVDSTGGTHPTNFQGSYVNSPSGSSYCPPSSSNPPPNLPVATSDNSGYTIYPTVSEGSLSAYVTDKFAQTYNTPSYANGGSGSTEASYSAIDANGNEISGANGVYTDTTGKTALTVAGASPNPMTFAFSNPSGGTSKVTVNYGTYTVRTNFGCSGVSEYQASSQHLVTSIVLPDNSEYLFTYEPTPGYSGDYTGRIASIKLPSGGTITYQYTNASHPGGISCADDGNTYIERTLTADSGSSASTVTYARAANGGALPSGLACSAPSCTEVVDGYSNYSEYNFVPPYIPTTGPAGPLGQYYETSRKVYQGAASGTPVLARTTCYNGASNCSATSLTFPVSSVDTSNTLNGIYTDGSTTAYDGYGNVTGQTIYDFGSGSSRGGKLKAEAINYYTIHGLKTLDTVSDSSGSTIAKTEYDYDQGTPAPSSGVPQHSSVSGARGNLTAVKHYLSGSASIAQSLSYEDTGSIISSTDPSGATTNYSYDPTFVYNQGVGYPTPSSGVALSTSQSYDTSYSGLPKQFIDMNSQPTTIYSYDSSLRPTEVDYPDGGKATLSYSPTSVTANIYQTSSTYSTTETELDGYGRKSVVLMAKDQSGNWYEQDYCYDGNGNLGFVSYQYQTTTPGASKTCSGSGDTYSYDPLDRVTEVLHSDGTKLQYANNGRATQLTDENGVARITQVDGLGRPTIVCEISNGSGVVNSGSPSSCGTDIVNTGFTTNYAYNLAAGTTTVTQGVQTRTFQTDWLGRTISVTEPERGTTTYSYAYNSTGLQVTRVRPQANQTGSLTTTTTTQYDVIGRPISVSYSDGSPTKTFQYDGSSLWGVTLQYPKGRLIYQGTGNANAIYSYDPMGRVIGIWQCAPSNCGLATYSTSYSYDYAGNLKTSTDGGGNTDTYAYTAANQVQSITSSLNDVNHPANLLSNVSYGPFGPTLWQLGNGATDSRVYDTLGRVKTEEVCTPNSCYPYPATYSYTANWSGQYLTSSSDSVPNEADSEYYDSLGRLSSITVNGTANARTYAYDRWGNRWTQSGNGPQPSLSFNTSTNQITTSGYAYDAVGNMTSDGSHTYTYDAEGNVTKVDNGSTAKYTYDALNQRVRIDYPTEGIEYVFNPAGQHTSSFNAANHAVSADWMFWGDTQFAIYTNGTTLFDHQDWLGTERVRTDAQGNVNGAFQSLPYGDGYTVTGNDWDQYHFAGMDQDTTSNEHAQFREYSNMAGRWFSPDPYDGSYDFTNPQSFNRYAYVLDNPLSFMDRLGLECDPDTGDGCDSTPYVIYGYGFSPGTCDMSNMACQLSISNYYLASNAYFAPLNLGGIAIPSKKQPPQQQPCDNVLNGTPGGKVIQFFSLYNLVTNFKNAWMDWTVLPAAKVAAATAAKSASSSVGGTEFLSITGGESVLLPGDVGITIAAGEAAGSSAALPVIAVATATDYLGHVACNPAALPPFGPIIF